MHKRMSKIEGSVIDALRRQRDLEEEIRQYFYYDSPLWRAIVEHIGAKGCCALFDKERGEDGIIRLVAVRRGTGYAVTGKDRFVRMKLIEGITYGMTISVGYESEYDDDRGYSKSYHVEIPFDLEENFRQERFDIWIKSEAKKRGEEALARNLPELQKLVKKYPGEARQMLKNK